MKNHTIEVKKYDWNMLLHAGRLIPTAPQAAHPRMLQSPNLGSISKMAIICVVSLITEFLT
jgi:hypothetical protein